MEKVCNVLYYLPAAMQPRACGTSRMSTFPALWDRIVAYWPFVGKAVISWSIWVVLCLLVWSCSYAREYEYHFDGNLEDPIDIFNNGRFGCLKTPRLCLCACLCPALRWADTIDMADLATIPMAMGLFFASCFIDDFVYMPAFFGIFTCLLLLYYRHILRQRLDLPNWTVSSCFSDLLYIFCCPCCAIAQEARVVRYATFMSSWDLAKKLPNWPKSTRWTTAYKKLMFIPGKPEDIIGSQRFEAPQGEFVPPPPVTPLPRALRAQLAQLPDPAQLAQQMQGSAPSSSTEPAPAGPIRVFTKDAEKTE